MENILECRALTKTYGYRTALSNLDIAIPRGRIVGLLGPNGSGKTTLIKLACGLLTPTAGQILIDGKAPGLESKAIVSYLPERSYLNNWMCIQELIRFFQDFYQDFQPEVAYDMLQRLNIDPRDRLPPP